MKGVVKLTSEQIIKITKLETELNRQRDLLQKYNTAIEKINQHKENRNNITIRILEDSLLEDHDIALPCDSLILVFEEMITSTNSAIDAINYNIEQLNGSN